MTFPILETNPGGSPRGVSWYNTPCARQRQLLDQLRAENPEKESKPTPGSQLILGTFFHQYAEWFEAGEESDATIQVSDIAYDDDRQTAQDLFRAYKSRVKAPGFWGETIGTEMPLPPDGLEDVKQMHILGHLGVELTGKADYIVRVTEDSLAAIEAEFGLSLPGTGVYIIDYKTKGRQASYEALVHGNSVQFAVYPELYNICHDEMPKGTIAVAVYTRKTKGKVDIKRVAEDIQCYFVPTASEIWLNQVRQYLAFKEAYLKTGAVNLGACFDWNRVCYFLECGACSGGL